MNFKTSGEITKITEVQKGTSKAGKDWQKLTFVIDTKEEYNNILAFDVFGDEKVENFIKYNKVGRSVEIEFNIRTNEWKDKFFTSLDAWKISKANDTETAIAQATATIDAVFEPAGDLNAKQEDLPF
jgi:hypothetical protein